MNQFMAQERRIIFISILLIPLIIEKHGTIF